MSAHPKPSIVFVHGIWADGSSFAKLIAPLQAEGYEVIAAQYGLDSHASDVAAVRNTLAVVSNPVILVGHSYGGSIITAAGIDPRVSGLVYIAALAPDDDETSGSLQEKFPTSEIFSQVDGKDGRIWSHVDVKDGRLWMKPHGIKYFAGDLSEEEQKTVWATHAPPAISLLTEKVEGTAWKTKPSWYIVANQDGTIQPELERFVAKRMGATTFEIDSSHVPMLSHPEFVLDVIGKAARKIQEDMVAA